MEKTNDNMFEILAKNKMRRSIIKLLLSNIETTYPVLSLTKYTLREGDYWEGIEAQGKKVRGVVAFIDLPIDLGLKEDLISSLKKEYDRLQVEFDSYKINK